jgi:hypothetical protein
MTDATVTLAGSAVSREEVAQFENLAAHAGYQFGPGVTEAILEGLAAGVPPKGLATVLDVLSRRQAQAHSTAAAGIRERGRLG